VKGNRRPAAYDAGISLIGVRVRGSTGSLNPDRFADRLASNLSNALNRNSLDLIEANLIAPAIIGLRRARQGVARHRCGLLDSAAGLEVRRDSDWLGSCGCRASWRSLPPPRGGGSSDRRRRDRREVFLEVARHRVPFAALFAQPHPESAVPGARHTTGVGFTDN
jgi:hypothetical protein